MFEEELNKGNGYIKEQTTDKEAEKMKAERKLKIKRCLLKEDAKADKCGVCYFSQIPPRMDPIKLHQFFPNLESLKEFILHLKVTLNLLILIIQE